MLIENLTNTEQMYVTLCSLKLSDEQGSSPTVEMSDPTPEPEGSAMNGTVLAKGREEAAPFHYREQKRDRDSVILLCAAFCRSCQIHPDSR